MGLWMKIEQIKLRPPKPSDLNFIQSTFSKCIKKESSLGRSCSTKVFYSEFAQVIDHLLSNSSVSVACNPDNEDQIFGYMIHDPSTIHFVFIKSIYQNLNIAKEMIQEIFPDEKVLSFSFSTNASKKISNTHPNLIFNPFSLYRKGLAA